MTGLYRLAARTPWMIHRPWLDLILDVAARVEVTPDRMAAVGRTPDWRRTHAVAARRGEPVSWSEEVTLRDGVAILPVMGPIFRHASLFTDLSQATTVDSIAADFHAALRDPQVRSILLNFDSPGGEASGIGEMAGLIHRARGVKPIAAYVGSLGCSAAYYLAAAAERLIAHPSAILGSIGVLTTWEDDRAVREAEGIVEHTFVSSGAPHKHVDPATDSGRLAIQKILDDQEAVFVSDVARFRGVGVETVYSDFGGGGVLAGDEAVAVRMADRLGTFEETLTELARTPAPTTSSFRVLPRPSARAPVSFARR